MKTHYFPHNKHLAAWCVSALSLAVLSACGGGSDQEAVEPAPAAPLATQTVTLQLAAPTTLPDEAAALVAQPSFHVAPLLLDAPDDTDVMDHSASAGMRPRTQAIPAGQEGLSTQRLTAQSIEAARRVARLGGSGTVAPRAAASVVATYSPAQIRAAYGLPPLPAAGTPLSATQAAQLGAGQTIYIIDAMHDPNAAAELAAFNQKFGLPACTTKAIATGAALPLAKASSSTCEFSVVYNTASGTMTGAAPAYDAGWATEIALDVQWAHATAPLARIVLIEAPNASLDALLGAVKLANAMGPGAVSMSFGASEGSYTASVDTAFAGAGMSYLAATGDSGAGVSWPSVSPKVVAVGGTSLSYSGSGARVETVWSGTGGGVSAYTPVPGYQTAAVPGMGSVARRSVADVAFNADPSTGQYVAVMSPGSSAINWLSVGGTSLSTPQWAGLVAMANAQRSLAAKPALGAPHAVLYGQVGAVPGTYAAAFADINKGANGSCSGCAAKAGYDTPSGLGTPNVSALLSALSGTSTVSAAPVVSSANVSGTAGTALSFTVSVVAPNPVTYTLIAAPSGMAIGTTGVVSWAKPVAGTYSVGVVAKDAKTGLTGQGVYTLQIGAATVSGPVITAPAMTGVAGKKLVGTISISAPGATGLSVSISGVPSGMGFSVSGLAFTATWASPVVGAYSLKVVAVDSNGKTASANVPITITAK